MPGRDAVRTEAAQRSRWLVLATVTLAAFITNVDATIVVIGLPRLVAGLQTTVTTGLWTLTAYVLTSTVLLLPAGRWSDAVGRRRIFVVGVTVFSIATVLCGLASSGGVLIGDRLLQGAGGALALATGIPLVVDVFPARELGRALGVNSTAWVLGSLVGPVAGGALVGAFGWRSIFFVTAPFGVLAAGLGVALLPAGTRRQGERNDWGGLGAFSVALASLLLALSEGLPWGWTSWRILGLFAVAAAAAATFVVLEARSPSPLFDLGLLRGRDYRKGLGIVSAFSVGFFATTFLLTFYLQGSLRLSPLDAGLLLVPLSVPQLFLAPLGGHLADRIGPARLVVAGFVLLVVSAGLLGELGPTLSLPRVVVPLLVMSCANATGWPALTKFTMSGAPPERTGAASGMFFTLRNVGMALSLTLALVVAEASLPPAVAVRVFLGVGSSLGAHAAGALVRSTDAGFRLFLVSYAVGLALALTTLRARSAPALRRAAPVPAASGEGGLGAEAGVSATGPEGRAGEQS
jgi:EmrB/QacA subfamily drug resistance transporter